jgi:Spy/CpxP family protein refolding chaperone
MYAWWNARRRAAFGEEASCGPEGGPWGCHGGRHGHHHGGPGPEHGSGGGGGEDFGGFGVRRPLRFLAYKLDLDEPQIAELATVLSDLKTERAQAAVDHRRTTSAFAESVAAESYDEAKAKAAAEERSKSNERVQAAVVRALGRIHGLLKPEQRSKLAYLLRTGALSV